MSAIFKSPPILLTALVIFAGGLSLFFFSSQSLRLDEAQSLWQTSRAPVDIATIVAKDVHVPLYHFLLYGWRLLFGGGVETARMLSLLFYLLSIPALYALGKLAYNKEAGLFAAALFAISPFMNWYGNEIRMYTLFTLLVILNQYFFIKLWKSARHTDSASSGAALYAVTAILGMYSHYFFFLVLAGQAVFYFLRRQIFPRGTLRKLITSWMLVALALLPWGYYVYSIGEVQNQEPLLQAPTSIILFNAFSQFLFGFQADHINTVFLSLWPIAVILAFLALRKRHGGISPETEYFFLTVMLSTALAFGISLTFHPVFTSRYLILAVPSLYLLVTSVFSLYPERAARFARGAALFVMDATLIIELFSPTTPVKENYREAAQYLTAHAGGADVILLSAPFTIYPIEYYYRGAAPIRTLPLWNRYAFGPIPPFIPDKFPGEVAQATQANQNAWILLSYDQGYQEDIRLYFDTHYQRTDERVFSPGLTLYKYKLRYDTPLSERSKKSIEKSLGGDVPKFAEQILGLRTF